MENSSIFIERNNCKREVDQQQLRYNVEEYNPLFFYFHG